MGGSTIAIGRIATPPTTGTASRGNNSRQPRTRQSRPEDIIDAQMGEIANGIIRKEIPVHNRRPLEQVALITLVATKLLHKRQGFSKDRLSDSVALLLLEAIDDEAKAWASDEEGEIPSMEALVFGANERMFGWCTGNERPSICRYLQGIIARNQRSAEQNRREISLGLERAQNFIVDAMTRIKGSEFSFTQPIALTMAGPRSAAF